MSRRRLGLTMSVIALTVLVGGTAALAASSGNGDDGAKVETFRVRAPEVDRVVTDLGPPGLSQQDQIIIKKDLYFEKEPDEKVGEDVVNCVVTEIEGDQRFEALCNTAYWFDGDGQIISQAVAHFDLADPGEFNVAITGGSGKYRGAGGWIKVIQSTEIHRLVFHVER
jgi:hypothetical protein